MERKIYSETDRQIEWLSTDRDKETKEEEYKLGEIKINNYESNYCKMRQWRDCHTPVIVSNLIVLSDPTMPGQHVHKFSQDLGPS